MAKANFSAFLDGLEQALSVHGYRRRGTSFEKDEEDARLFVHVQKGRASDSESVEFTVNLGVYLPLLGKQLGDLKQRVAPSDYHWSARLGHLLKPPKDCWWTVSSTSDVDELLATIVELVEHLALPKLQTLASTQRLFDHWSAGGYGGITELERERYVGALADICK